MSEIYIFGHKNPDTDSICASIAYAHLKNEITSGGYIACRLGDINNETEYVLKKCGAQTPRLIHDIHPQIQDAQYYPAVSLCPDDIISKAWNHMKDMGLTLLPVVDKDGTLTGIVSSQDITKAYMELVDPMFLSQYSINIFKIAQALGAEILCGKPTEEDLPRRLLILNNDNFEVASNDIILTDNNRQNIENCLCSSAKYIVITGGTVKDIERFKNEALTKGKILLHTAESIFAATRLIAQALPVGSLMKTEDLIVFQPNNKIDDVVDIMLENRHRYFPVVDLDYKPLGLISRRQLLTYKRKQVILVDHNEKGQSANGIETADILEVVDHHRLGDLQTGKPLFVNCKAIGCTCTIIAEQYFFSGVTPTKQMAQLMLSAIISDTLLFRSPTSTPQDKQIAQKLADICGLDVYEYGMEMLKEGAGVSHLTPKKMLNNDAKLYEIGKYKIHTCQILTTDYDETNKMLGEIEIQAEALCEKHGYSAVLMIITNFLKNSSEIIVFGREQKKIAEAIGIEKGNRRYFDGLMSRKSQVIPKLVLNLQK